MKGDGAAGPADRSPLVGATGSAYGATVRDRGGGSAEVVGRPVLRGGLRARVVRWPPLRPARLRCARGSLGVASPTRSRHQNSSVTERGRGDELAYEDFRLGAAARTALRVLAGVAPLNRRASVARRANGRP